MRSSQTSSRFSHSCLRLALLATFVLLAACGGGEESVFSEITSPDGAWTLRVTVAESRMPQGPFYVSAYLIDKAGQVQKMIETKLENDGVPFTTSNIAARWVSANSALMCLRATDLPDRGIRFDVGGAPSMVEVDQC